MAWHALDYVIVTRQACCESFEQKQQRKRTMKHLLACAALLIALPVSAETPLDVQINTTGTFDANLVYSGTYTASGAISEVGAQVDTPVFTGAAFHVTRLLSTTKGHYIAIAINSNHVSGEKVSPPDWCPPPPTPNGTYLFREGGNWTIAYGTGPYALLQGTGTRVAWVVVDAVLNIPVAATECLLGKTQYQK
jgi:hypothetical protein